MNKSRYTIIVFILLYIGYNTNAQDEHVRDSLLNLIENETENESFKINPMIDLAWWHISHGDIAKGTELLYSAEKLSIDLENLEWLPLIYHRLGLLPISDEEFDIVVAKVEALIDQIPSYSKGQIESLTYLALIFSNREKHEKGLELLFDIEQRVGSSKESDRANFYIYLFRSQIYNSIKDFESTRENAEKAYEYASVMKDTTNMTYSKIGYCLSFSKAKNFEKSVSCYLAILADFTMLPKRIKIDLSEEIAASLVSLQRYDDAIIHILSGLENSSVHKDSISLMKLMAECYGGKGDAEKAMQIYDRTKSIIFRSKSYQNGRLSDLGLSKGRYLLKIKKTRLALPLLLDVLVQNRKDSVLDYRDETYWENLNAIVKCYESIGQLDSAAIYYAELVRSMKKEREEQAAFRTVRNNARQLETSNRIELAALNTENTQQKWLLLLLGGMAVVFFSLGGIIWRQSKNISREKQKSESLLSNMLPASIAERVKKGEHLIADHYPEATVVFIDMVGFTALSAKYPPHEIISLLDEIFSKIDSLVDEYSLEKIKTIGDCYMAVAGVPSPHKSHLENALLFSKEVIKKLKDLKFKENPIHFKIGIETGDVIAGVIGKKRILFDLWGDTVNTASRLESNGLPNQIQVTKLVFEKMKHRFEFENRGTLDIKGKGKIEAFLLKQ